jgi:hypothetical protein
MAAITVTTRVLGDTVTTVLPNTRPKRGLRGVFLGLPYIGPVLSGARPGTQSIVHATGAAAGGAEDSTGYREKDTYDATGNTGGLAGGPATSVSRPTGRTAFIGAGVAGGSTPGAPIDATGRAVSTGKDRFGRAKGVANVGAGLGTYDYTNFDERPTLDGDGGRALGADGRGSMTTDGETVTQTVTRAVVGAAAGPAAGTVGIVDGGAGGLVQVDLHADDITGGAGGLAGYEVSLFKRDKGDTDEDGPCIGVFDVDGGTDITTLTTVAAIAGTTIVVYARKRYAMANGGATTYGYGPTSARATLAVT